MREITLNDVREIARDSARRISDQAEEVGKFPRIFLHWSAGRYGTPFPDYHINIGGNGELYTNVSYFSEVLSHTWRNNTGSVGVSMLCCYNGTPKNLGEYPPTKEQIETMARVIAVLAEELNIPIDKDHVLTHAEQADIDGYGPSYDCQRWDLAILSNDDEWMSGGDILRGKAIWYQQNGVNT